jgi:hypothetical protein
MGNVSFVHIIETGSGDNGSGNEFRLWVISESRLYQYGPPCAGEGIIHRLFRLYKFLLEGVMKRSRLGSRDLACPPKFETRSTQDDGR